MLLDLADACRASGLTVVEEVGWRTRGHGGMSGVRSIVAHHTAGPPTGDAPSLGVVRDGRAGLPGPLAQLFLTRSGRVHVVAAGLAYHAGVVFDPTTQSNAYAIGIEAEATGVDPWPAGQYAAYARLCAALVAHYRLPVSRVLGHKEVASPAGRKIDPNFPMDAFRVAVADALEGNRMELTDRLPDFYTGDPGDTLSVGDTMAWGTRHAAVAVDRSIEARDRAIEARNIATAVRTDVAALAAKVDALALTGGQVDLDALAERVADLLAARLAA